MGTEWISSYALERINSSAVLTGDRHNDRDPPFRCYIEIDKHGEEFIAALRRRFSAEEKIRIVLEGLRGEEGIAALCRREGIAPNLYYRWSKEFLEPVRCDDRDQATGTQEMACDHIPVCRQDRLADRAAAGGDLEFKRTYNEQWMLEKYDYRSPAQVRRDLLGLDAAA